MKKLIFFVFVFIVSLTLQAQFKQLDVPSNENLRTAGIANNGDIYVFGDNMLAAKYSDGQWEILNIFGQGNISACLLTDDYIFVSNQEEVFVEKDRWRIYSTWNQEVAKIDIDQNENIYFFPRLTGLGSRSKNQEIISEEGAYVWKMNFNFYLPLAKTWSKGPNMRYVSALAGNNIITFLHDLRPGASTLHSVYHSADGYIWEQSFIEPGGMAYVIDCSFVEDSQVGFLVGTNYGKQGFYVFSSLNGGKSWYLEQEKIADNNYQAKSIYSYYFNNRYNYIIVGKNKDQGFIWYNNKVIYLPVTLNYVTGKKNKIVVVGDQGQVFVKNL